MIVTPEHLIKQYFPEPVETTRVLYDHLELAEQGYSYSNWLMDLEKYCLSKYLNDSDYKLLDDREKNYWISPRAFRTILESSPSKIGDQIRSCAAYISRKVATDPAFARQLQDQLDQENGVKAVIPKASKKLKARYNETGTDVFEFSIQADKRLYMEIISAHNFQPGQKIKSAFFNFKFEVEDDTPFHIIEITLTLAGNDMLSYRTIWSCQQERLRYGAILVNRVIRVDLFQDNKKLFDSYEYILSPSDIKALELELEKVIDMTMNIKPEETDFDRLGEKILNRYNLNDQAYALAINEAIPALPKNGESADIVETAFLDAINRYWECYVLRSDPTVEYTDDLDQMVKERIPRVALALIVTNMLNYGDLCDRYLKRRYSDKIRLALINAGNIRLIYALAAHTEFDPGADAGQRINDMCAFITDNLDLIIDVLAEMGLHPSN